MPPQHPHRGLRMVLANKRYIGWFWMLNLFWRSWELGLSRKRAYHPRSQFYSDRLTQGLHLADPHRPVGASGVRCDHGHRDHSRRLACLLVFSCYRAISAWSFCGIRFDLSFATKRFLSGLRPRNLWRFIRLIIIAGIVMGIIAGLLFWASGAIATKAEESTYELLPFTLRTIVALFLIFLIMTTLRIWFDLAESDVVLNDQRAVRRAIAAGFRHTFHSLGRLLASYVLATLSRPSFWLSGFGAGSASSLE